MEGNIYSQKFLYLEHILGTAMIDWIKLASLVNNQFWYVYKCSYTTDSWTEDFDSLALALVWAGCPNYKIRLNQEQSNAQTCLVYFCGINIAS